MKQKAGLFILFLLFSAAAFPARAFAAPLRELRVAVAVTPEYKSLPNWKGEFERRLGYASRIFENQFRIKFRIGAYADWPSPDEQGGTAGLMEDLH